MVTQVSRIWWIWGMFLLKPLANSCWGCLQCSAKDSPWWEYELNFWFLLYCFVPKKYKPHFVNQFRPTSLFNVLYNLVSIVITHRLKPLMNFIISSNQNAFIPGRIITNNILLANECIHSMKNIKRGRARKITIKLDISKAYDRVEWVYIEKVM